MIEECLKQIKSYVTPYLMAKKNENGDYAIGYGFTEINGKPVKIGDKITQEQADKILSDLVVKAMQRFEGFNNNQKQALVSFAFTNGDLAKLMQDETKIRDSFKKFNTVKGKYNRALGRLRAEQAILFNTPCEEEESEPKGLIEIIKSFEPYQAKVSSDKFKFIRIRKEPEGEQVELATVGSTIEVLEETNKEWFKVDYKNKAGKHTIGYMMSKFIAK